MKIYTKTGDQGETSLLGGKRVTKNHLRIESYGTVDELIAHLGMIRDTCNIKSVSEEIITIQDHLMACAAILAADCDDCEAKVPKLSEEVLVWVEKSIDKMEEKLPELTSFILPGGHIAVSAAHIARTVCRRAERCVLTLAEKFEVPEIILQYLNRLSDYLFVLSRFISKEYEAVEIPWQPRLQK